MPRQCAVTLVPLAGESVDGWLRSLAHYWKCGVADIASEAGLSRDWISATCRAIASGVPSDSLEGLATLTGLGMDLLADLGLAMRTHVETVEPSLRQRGQTSMGALYFSRYCPQCLAANGGRWLATWRLPWNLLCTDHQCLLETTCPEGHHQYQRRMPLGPLPHPPLRCLFAFGGSRGCRPKVCGADLSEATARLAPEPLSLLTAHFAGLSDPHHPSFETSLILLQRFLVVARSEATHHGVKPSPKAYYDTDSLDFLTLAAEAALDPHGESMRIAAVRDTSRVLLPASWKATDGPLSTAAVVARRDKSNVIDQLRWSITPEGAAPPTLGQADAKRLADQLPRSLWPGWAVALASTQRVSDNTVRSGAVFGLMVAASSADLREIAALIGIDERGLHCLKQTLQEWHRRTEGVSTHTLIELARTLRAEPPPIDYERRRRLAAASPLIEPSDWTAMASRLGLNGGDGYRLGAARAWLWACLTGERIADAPKRLAQGARTDNYDGFLVKMPASFFSALREHLRSFLDEHGASREPLEWEPPLDLIPGGGLPLRRPDDIDTAALRRLLDHGVTPKAAARRLGVTLAHVRLALHSGQLASESPPTSRKPIALGRRCPPITPDLLVDLIWVKGLSLKRASAILETNSRALGRLCRALDVEVPASGRRSSISTTGSPSRGWRFNST
jgi:hypothetical protein